ncbi:MAG: hypothetical protein RJS98_00775 [Rhodospirillaceae bacterium]
MLSDLFFPKSITAFFAVGIAATVLSGCALEPVPPCPEIRIDSNTSQLTYFAPGIAGRGISDVG